MLALVFAHLHFDFAILLYVSASLLLFHNHLRSVEVALFQEISLTVSHIVAALRLVCDDQRHGQADAEAVPVLLVYFQRAIQQLGQDAR